MNARAPSFGRVSAHMPGRALSFGIDSRCLETLKWIGLVAMLVAHVAQYVYGVREGWPIEVGRIAFPLFAVSFAVALGQDPSARGYRSAFRLVPFALAAQLFSQLVRDEPVLNVLFQFVAVGAWCAAGDYAPGKMIVTRSACLVVALLSEFWLPGFLVLLSLVRVCQDGEITRGGGAQFVIWFSINAWSQGSAWSFAFLVPLVLVLVSESLVPGGIALAVTG